ncbi:hypothetical protein [Cohnella kolymensis]|uniref:hypothetical protein n=1 Tax=Cohnella kolymensis TaxID=1590652 RepID=UPI000AE71B9D|nr:hypothetical protein [Cohnella kolymensis]
MPAQPLSYASGTLAVAALLISSLRARGLYFYTGLVFLIVGVVLFLYNGLPPVQFLVQFQSMLGLLGLFMVLPSINWLIYIGRFDKTVKQLFQKKVSRWDQLYGRGTAASQLLGNFLNIATIPLLAKALRASLNGLSEPQIHPFLSRCLLRSYALALTWSPMEVMVSKSIDITGAKFLVIFPIMLGLTVIVVFVDVKLSSFRYRTIAYLPKFELQESDAKNTN